jgi:hypothetical protein
VHDFALPGATAEYHLTSELALFFKRFSKKTQGDSETVILDPDSTTYGTIVLVFHTAESYMSETSSSVSRYQ